MDERGERSRTHDGAISEVERDLAVTRLNRACGEGLLTLQEFGARVEAAAVARTRAELDRLVADLPADGARDPGADRRTHWHVVPVGAIHRHGRWRMDRHLVSLSVLGGANLDLRQAQLATAEVKLTKVAMLGGVTLCVPPGVRVVIEGCGLLGRRKVVVAEATGKDAPTLRVRAYSLLGGVTVARPPT